MKFKVILHSNITENQLKDIVSIKSIFGDYSFESQLRWVDEHISESDYHVLGLGRDGELLSYTNLLPLKVNIDEVQHSALGVGNVCVAVPGKGCGSELMKFINSYIRSSNNIGLLYCKEELVRFYSKVSWYEIKNTSNSQPFMMVLDLIYGVDYTKISYDEKMF